MVQDDKNKGTDRDFRPTRGQESNENWDDSNTDREDTNASDSSDARIIDEQTNTSGAGSSQRSNPDNAAGNVGPLDADLEQLPSQKRRDRGSNLTGPGLG
jgi:hypothetical protein